MASYVSKFVDDNVCHMLQVPMCKESQVAMVNSCSGKTKVSAVLEIYKGTWYSTHMHACMHLHMHAYTSACARRHTHTHTHTHTHAFIHTHTHTYMHMHACAHAHTHTDTQTHTCLLYTSDAADER